MTSALAEPASTRTAATNKLGVAAYTVTPLTYPKYSGSEAYRQEIHAGLQPLLEELTGEGVSVNPDALQKTLRQPAATVLLARSQADDIVGLLIVTIISTPLGDEARLNCFVVHDSFRGKGVGKLLLQKAEDTARKANADIMEVICSPKRIGARDFLKKRGFEDRHDLFRRILKKFLD